MYLARHGLSCSVINSFRPSRNVEFIRRMASMFPKIISAYFRQTTQSCASAHTCFFFNTTGSATLIGNKKCSMRQFSCATYDFSVFSTSSSSDFLFLSLFPKQREKNLEFFTSVYQVYEFRSSQWLLEKKLGGSQWKEDGQTTIYHKVFK